MPNGTAAEKIDTLLQGELLNHDQAEAFVRRVIEGQSLAVVAREMGCSEEIVQNNTTSAARMIFAAQETLLALESVGAVPNICENCGSPLGTEMAIGAEGEVYCQECSRRDEHTLDQGS